MESSLHPLLGEARRDQIYRGRKRAAVHDERPQKSRRPAKSPLPVYRQQRGNLSTTPERLGRIQGSNGAIRPGKQALLPEEIERTAPAQAIPGRDERREGSKPLDRHRPHKLSGGRAPWISDAEANRPPRTNRPG